MMIGTTGRAMLVQDGGKVLAIKYGEDCKIYYALPGGQHHGESLHRTLQRELVFQCSTVEPGILSIIPRRQLSFRKDGKVVCWPDTDELIAFGSWLRITI